MHKLIILFGFIIGSNSCISNKEEYFIGIEKLVEISSNIKLIHKNHLLLKGDSAFLYKEPFFVKNGDTIRSASDGGFYYYRGKIIKTPDQDFQCLKLELINCDYCIRETLLDSTTGKHVFKHEINSLKVEPGKNLTIDGIEYKYQLSERYPIDMLNFYACSKFEIEKTQEIEFSELTKYKTPTNN